MTEERVPYANEVVTPRATYAVRDSGGDLRKYRIELPNLIDDMELSIYAFRLYVHLKRVAGSDGACFQSTKTLAKHCGISIGKIVEAKKELADKGLINIEKRDRTKNETDLITIYDIWPQNFAFYSRIEEGDPVHHMNTPRSPHEQGVHHMNGGVHVAEREEVTNIKKEPNKNKPNEEDVASQPDAQEKTQTPQQEMFGAICEALGVDYHIISKETTGQIAQVSKILRRAEYTVEDVRLFMVDIWFKDWRWTKHQQYPTIKLLREGLGQLRSVIKDVAPKEKKTGIEGYREVVERMGLKL